MGAGRMPCPHQKTIRTSLLCRARALTPAYLSWRLTLPLMRPFLSVLWVVWALSGPVVPCHASRQLLIYLRSSLAHPLYQNFDIILSFWEGALLRPYDVRPTLTPCCPWSVGRRDLADLDVDDSVDGGGHERRAHGNSFPVIDGTAGYTKPRAVPCLPLMVRERQGFTFLAACKPQTCYGLYAARS